MAALDTNVLVRWLTNDDAGQCARVEVLFRKSLAEGERLFVPVTVMLETEWVLRSRYRFERATISGAIDALLRVPELELQNEPALERALWLFKQDDASDFADCLHLGLVSEGAREPLWTFDIGASAMAGVSLLSS